MTIDETKVEQILKIILQKHVKIYLKNKLIKEGKLILFRQSNYYLELILKLTNEQLKSFEIPIPYDIEYWNKDGLVYFDYRLSTLGRNSKDLVDMIGQVPRKGNSKFYNTVLEICVA